MTYTYMEWNLHGCGGRNCIPEFVAQEVLKQNFDIVVLTEFNASAGWENFRAAMEKRYELHVSPYAKGYNQVCIAVKRGCFDILRVDAVNIVDYQMPELLRLDTKEKKGKENLTIVGARIKTQGHEKVAQRKFLGDYLRQIPYQKLVCLGDFNYSLGELKEDMAGLEAFGPRTANGLYSYVCSDGRRMGRDWIISRGISHFENPFADKGESPYATYDWSFVTSENGYGYRLPEDPLIDLPLPDHAILMGEFCLE